MTAELISQVQFDTDDVKKTHTHTQEKTIPYGAEKRRKFRVNLIFNFHRFVSQHLSIDDDCVLYMFSAVHHRAGETPMKKSRMSLLQRK